MFSPVNLRSTALLLTLTVLTFLGASEAQAIKDDSINFDGMPGWSDLRECVKRQFTNGDRPIPIASQMGCTTNACLCRPSVLGEAITVIEDWVMEACANYDDQKLAVNLLIDYCAEKGYTEIATAVVPEPTGASMSLVTIAGCTMETYTYTYTAVVTQTVTIRSDSSAAAPGLLQWSRALSLLFICLFMV